MHTLRPSSQRLQPTISNWLSWLGILCLSGMCVLAWGEDKGPRVWKTGALTAEDFEGKPDPNYVAKNMQGMTDTEMHYTFRYRSEAFPNKAIIALSDLDVFSVFSREKSWLTPLGAKTILDHEQGHFDLIEIQALTAKKELLQRLHDKKIPKFQGKTVDEAVKELNAWFKEELKKYQKTVVQENEDYDRLTRHGVAADIQAEHRRIQKLTLSKLQEELSELKTK